METNRPKKKQRHKKIKRSNRKMWIDKILRKRKNDRHRRENEIDNRERKIVNERHAKTEIELSYCQRKSSLNKSSKSNLDCFFNKIPTICWLSTNLKFKPYQIFKICECIIISPVLVICNCHVEAFIKHF